MYFYDDEEDEDGTWHGGRSSPGDFVLDGDPAPLNFWPMFIRPHRNTTYAGAAYRYQSSSVVCRSVCWSVCHASEPCKNCCTDRDAVWVEDSGEPREPCIRCGSRSPHAKGQFWGGKGRPIVKYRETLRSSMQKRLNRSRCRLGCGLGWAVGIRGPAALRDVAMATNFGMPFGIIGFVATTLVVW